MNVKEITYARGYVVDKFISIELGVAHIIFQHFLNRIDMNFMINVLNNEQSSFAFKRNILIQIIGEEQHKENIESLRRLNNLRNTFGHASLRMVEDKSPHDEGASLNFNDPKREGGILDAQKLYDEFKNLYPQVMDWLMDIGKKRGVIHTPS